MADTGGPFYVPADRSVVVDATAAVQQGDLARLDALIGEFPWLPAARFGDPNCYRTLLHAATDWPGNFPNGPGVVALLVNAGADVNAHSRFASHTETPLHWAASSDNVAVLDALLDAGADIEASGAVLGGGSPLTDACGFGNWAAARRLVERGAHTRVQDAAALGLMGRVEAAFGGDRPPGPEEITRALWSACAGDQLSAARWLVERGADINLVGWDDLTPLDAAERADARDVADWLLAQGAKRAAEAIE